MYEQDQDSPERKMWGRVIRQAKMDLFYNYKRYILFSSISDGQYENKYANRKTSCSAAASHHQFDKTRLGEVKSRASAVLKIITEIHSDYFKNDVCENAGLSHWTIRKWIKKNIRGSIMY